LIRSCAKHDMQESKRGALTVNASRGDKTKDEMKDEMKRSNGRGNDRRDGDKMEKSRVRRPGVAPVSASRACGCRVLMNPEQARHCASNAGASASRGKGTMKRTITIKRTIACEEPTKAGAFGR